MKKEKEPLERKISGQVLRKLKGFATKSRFQTQTLGKTYSTYAIEYCFRKTYPGTIR